MKVKAIDFKNWANANLSPLAWQRIVLKSLPGLKPSGLQLSDLTEPSADLVLANGALEAILESTEAIYNAGIPEALFVR